MSNKPMKAADNIDALVCAALDMLDCTDLTDQERARADEIYDLCNCLEILVTERALTAAAVHVEVQP